MNVRFQETRALKFADSRAPRGCDQTRNLYTSCFFPDITLLRNSHVLYPRYCCFMALPHFLCFRRPCLWVYRAVHADYVPRPQAGPGV